MAMTSAESQRKYREAHPGRKEEQQKAFHDRHPRKAWEYRIKWMYGITIQEFEEKRQSQENKCAICLKEFIDTPCIDHNHVTKKNRDLLCRLCNRALGLFSDSSEILLRASQYLERHKE
jgi:hypothetical protein